MKAYFAKRGTGEVGPTVVREDGVIFEREKRLRRRDYFSIFGKLPVPRSCYRTAGESGIFPLDERVNLPKRCYSYFLQDWMTQFGVEHPFDESAGLFEQLFDLHLSPSVLIEVAREAAEDHDAFYEARETPQVNDGEILCVGFDGKQPLLFVTSLYSSPSSIIMRSRASISRRPSVVLGKRNVFFCNRLYQITKSERSHQRIFTASPRLLRNRKRCP